MPNLLVRDVSKAIAISRAVKVFVCNLMTQANESLGLTASDHIRALYKHARHQFFDYALVNRTPASPALALKYAEKQQSQIETDVDAIEALGVKPILGEYLLEAHGFPRRIGRPPRYPSCRPRPAAADDGIERGAGGDSAAGAVRNVRVGTSRLDLPI